MKKIKLDNEQLKTKKFKKYYQNFLKHKLLKLDKIKALEFVPELEKFALISYSAKKIDFDQKFIVIDGEIEQLFIKVDKYTCKRILMADINNDPENNILSRNQLYEHPLSNNKFCSHPLSEQLKIKCPEILYKITDECIYSISDHYINSIRLKGLTREIKEQLITILSYTDKCSKKFSIYDILSLIKGNQVRELRIASEIIANGYFWMVLFYHAVAKTHTQEFGDDRKEETNHANKRGEIQKRNKILFKIEDKT